jgi:uncharacterized membrane protein
MSFWLHMAATIVWIGGLFFQAVILGPALEASTRASESFDILVRIDARFRPLAWLSLAVLVVTGLVQMVLNPNYGGMLSFANTWSAAIFAKHLAIGGMIAIAGFQTWVLQPQIRKAIILQAASKAENESIEVTSRFKRFSRVNLILGVIVLGFTALARASL